MEQLKYSEILKLNKELAQKDCTSSVSIALLSNVTINSFKEILEFNLRSNDIAPSIEIGNFDNVVQDSAVFNTKDVVIIMYDMMAFVDNISIFFEDISENLYQDLKNKIFSEIDIILVNLKSTKSVVFNLLSAAYFVPNSTQSTQVARLVSEANNYLQVQKTNNWICINIDNIFLKLGLAQAIDYRFYNSSKAPYSASFLKMYADAVLPILLRVAGRLKKAIIFDCDNTLWSGIIGEDGMDGIDMNANSKKGIHYHKVQQIANYLSKKGIIVGVCSKNNFQDVEEVFSTHKDMFLKNENIVLKKVNWEDKVHNLQQIAQELNIGLESLVFIDDSSFEINLIKEFLPQIATLQVPLNNISEYPNLLLKTVYKYFNFNVNKEDAMKTLMYQQQFEREQNKKTFGALEDYIASLGISITIDINNKENIPRIAQLTQKTNQFNLTTKRYSEDNISDFIDTNNFIFTIYVKDKFGDSGLTGLAIIINQDEETAVIDSLLLSCRVIGRNIEFAFLNTIIAYLFTHNFTHINASYIPSSKNMQVSDYYEKMNFALISTNEKTKNYILSKSNSQLKDYNYIEVNKKFE